MENEIFQKMLKLESSHWWFVARRKIIQKAIKNNNVRSKLKGNVAKQVIQIYEK